MPSDNDCFGCAHSHAMTSRSQVEVIDGFHVECAFVRCQSDYIYINNAQTKPGIWWRSADMEMLWCGCSRSVTESVLQRSILMCCLRCMWLRRRRKWIVKRSRDGIYDHEVLMYIMKVTVKWCECKFSPSNQQVGWIQNTDLYLLLVIYSDWK